MVPLLRCFPFFLLFLSLLLSVGGGWARSVELALRHFSGEGERATALLYAGTPLRAVPLALRFTVPPEVADAFASANNASQGVGASADAADLPGQYPALWLPPNDPIVTAAQLGADASWDTVVGTQQLIAQPFVDTTTRGAALSLCVAVSPYAGGLDRGGRARGVLALGPGSSAWLRWSFVRLTRNTLLLSDERPHAASSKAGTFELPCSYFDERGRCVVDVGAASGHTIVPQARSNSGRAPRPLSTPVRWLVLDFDAASGELPPALYARLLHGAPPASAASDTVALAWTPRNAPSLLLARSEDVGDGTAGGIGAAADEGGGSNAGASATPPFVARASLANDTIVLGRRTLTRLFAALDFDAAAAVWIASPSVVFTEETRLALSTLSVIQVVLLAYFFASPLNLGLATAFSSTMRPIVRLPFLFLPFAALSAGIALAQCVLGYQYAGAGFGADAVVGAAMEHLTWVLLIHVGVLSGAALVTVAPLVALACWRQGALRVLRRGVVLRAEVATAFAAHFALCGLLGMVAGLAPLAAITMVAHLLLSLLAVGLFVPTALYEVCALGVWLIVPSTLTFRARLRNSTLLGGYALVVLASIMCVTYVSAVDALMPMLRAANVLYTDEVLTTAATVAVLTAVVAAVLLVVADTRTLLQNIVQQQQQQQAKTRKNK